MDILWYIVIGIIICIIVFVILYMYIFRYWFDYRKAKKEIIPYVQSYKRRCTGVNKFEVTVQSLQDSFREYDVKTIEKVWLDLVNAKVIERDPMDNEWCVR